MTEKGACMYTHTHTLCLFMLIRVHIFFCVHCMQLLGLEKEELCPECLTPIELSLHEGICMECLTDYDAGTGYHCNRLRCPRELSLCPVCAWPDIGQEMWLSYPIVKYYTVDAWIATLK